MCVNYGLDGVHVYFIYLVILYHKYTIDMKNINTFENKNIYIWDEI